jgi:hypothetical protein
VIVAAPALTPFITPVDELIVAIDVLLLAQLPPAVVSVAVMEPPIQAPKAPVALIAPTLFALTVTVCVTAQAPGLP